MAAYLTLVGLISGGQTLLGLSAFLYTVTLLPDLNSKIFQIESNTSTAVKKKLEKFCLQ